MIEFHKKPVLMTTDEMKQLTRNVRLKCAAGKVLSSPYFYATLGGLVANETSQAIAHFSLSHQVTALSIFTAILPATALTMVASSLLGQYFKRTVDQIGSRVARESMRNHEWFMFEMRMKKKILSNSLDNRSVRKISVLAQKGEYQLPVLSSERFSDHQAQIARSLGKLLPALPAQPTDRKTWEDYYRVRRFRRSTIKRIEKAQETPQRAEMHALFTKLMQHGSVMMLEAI